MFHTVNFSDAYAARPLKEHGKQAAAGLIDLCLGIEALLIKLLRLRKIEEPGDRPKVLHLEVMLLLAIHVGQCGDFAFLAV